MIYINDIHHHVCYIEDENCRSISSFTGSQKIIPFHYAQWGNIISSIFNIFDIFLPLLAVAYSVKLCLWINWGKMLNKLFFFTISHVIVVFPVAHHHKNGVLTSYLTKFPFTPEPLRFYYEHALFKESYLYVYELSLLKVLAIF